MRIKEEDYKDYTLIFHDRFLSSGKIEYCISILNPLNCKVATVVDPTSFKDAREEAIKIVKRRSGHSIDDYTSSKIRDLLILKPQLFKEINLRDYCKSPILEDLNVNVVSNYGELGWISIEINDKEMITYKFKWEDIENF